MVGSCPSQMPPNDADPRRSWLTPCGSTCTPVSNIVAPAGGATGPTWTFCQEVVPPTLMESRY